MGRHSGQFQSSWDENLCQSCSEISLSSRRASPPPKLRKPAGIAGFSEKAGFGATPRSIWRPTSRDRVIHSSSKHIQQPFLRLSTLRPSTKPDVVESSLNQGKFITGPEKAQDRVGRERPYLLELCQSDTCAPQEYWDRPQPPWRPSFLKNGKLRLRRGACPRGAGVRSRWAPGAHGVVLTSSLTGTSFRSLRLRSSSLPSSLSRRFPPLLPALVMMTPAKRVPGSRFPTGRREG